MARRLAARTVPREALSPGDREAMWDLFARHYEAVTRAGFEADLADKSHVILLRPAGEERLAGFSTLTSFPVVVQGRTVVVVFSGDTVVDPAWWGQTALQRAFLAWVIRVWLARPRTPVYWFLISKGYRTYLLLTRNFPEHWPRYDRPTPAFQAALLDTVARARFGDAWDADRGVLRFATCAGRLREGVAPVDPGTTAPDVRFFVARNPGHAEGDELCCLGRVDHRLWLFYMGRLARRALRSVGGRR